MASLELLNACWRASVHSKGVEFGIVSHAERICNLVDETEPRSYICEGGRGRKVGYRLRVFLHGRTVSLDISKPANSTVSIAKPGLSVMPCLPQRSSHSWACRKLSAIVEDLSSIHFVF